MTIQLATGPVTWGVDFADTPTNPPCLHVLDEIAASGLPAMELGPVGYLPEDPGAIRQLLADRNLLSAGSFVFDDLHDPAGRDRLVDITDRVCRVIAASGGTVLSLIDKPDDVRVATAGRPDVAPRLDGDRWASMLEQINVLAEIARHHGVRPVVHPHVGGYIEFEDEIERLVADTDLDLCLDTGHLAYARVDPVAALERYSHRLGHVHFKDIRPDVLARVDSERLTFWEAIEAGIFCPVGEGVVDIVAVLATLDSIGYSGFATIEQDRVPGSGTPLQDLLQSVAVIEDARGSQ
ncbi:MAG: TIM barrel protein [Ilumatobacteraceae bacterium]